jgi:Mn2+/Fe2+ NRAMP family transporter
MLFTYPLMTAVQIVGARMGRTTGRGIAGNLRQHCPSWLLTAIVMLLLIANAINIGADLGAMADASRLVLGGPQVLYVLLFAAICIALQMSLQYTRYVAIMMWMAAAPKIMGDFAITGWTKALGWVATAVMAVAVAAMLATS